ncbi:MAG: SIR2 family protein [Rhodocyclaceae bacterium]|nr:SIR2 family protein [Rhodocyclaceae bacterium]
MNEIIKSAIEKGELILFLGAGASKGGKTSSGVDILDGDALAEELAKRASIPYSGEPLDEAYAAVRAQLESRLDPILEQLLRHVRPSVEYDILGKYAWRRIYTLNIDDGIERAFRNSSQDIYVRLSADPFDDRDVFFNRLDLVKLNGSVDRLREGIIFSSAEYARSTNRALPWYEQCASDFLRMPFLFIGTKLNEPLLKFHIERYKTINGKTPGKSYVVTPSATPIQQASLLQFNIVHIPGTLSTFTNWLQATFPAGLTPLQLATASLPQYAGFLAAADRSAYAALLEGVSQITPDMASRPETEGAIRAFYKGFQPTWNDIVDGIPAELDILASSLKLILANLKPSTIVPFIGPAGSGKTTLLMQICYALCRSKGIDVYFIQEPKKDIRKALEALEQSSHAATRVIVAIDNVDVVSDQLSEALAAARLSKTTIICAERENSWKKRTTHKLGQFSSNAILVNEFSQRDAKKILAKLEAHGSWTVLGQMTENERVYALVHRAQKQLLIALLEATYGRGFGEIIESDYKTLTSAEERMFFLTVGVVTERHFDAPVSLVDRALSAQGILSKSTVLSEALSGIVMMRGDTLTARHPVYVRYLLEHIVDPRLTGEAIRGLLQAFSHYKAPVMKHLNKVEAAIYKKLINHKFLWEILKGKETLILSLYKGLEKSFELDGLFWLQYGLALRDMHDDSEALEKLRTAYSAYPMPHTQHALGQQLLILGSKAPDKTTALAYAEEARSLLEPIDDIIDSDDTYPVVTLAEGHTKLVRNIEGIDAARGIAKSYIAVLKAKCDAQPKNSRLRECHDRIFKFAATGTWAE